MKKLSCVLLVIAAIMVVFAFLSPLAASDDRSSSITPDDLLAAALSAGDLRQIRPQSEHWWPSFPEFIVGINQAKGERFYIAQDFTRTDKSTGDKIETVLDLYDDAGTASQAIKELCNLSLSDGMQASSGSSVGDESAYFVRSDKEAGGSVALRFRVGPVLGKIVLKSNDKPESLAELAAPVARKIHWLLAGRLKAKALPQDVDKLLPPKVAQDNVGPVCGTIVAPVESWALIDDLNNPGLVRDTLQRGGVSRLLFRRYAVAEEPANVMEVTLFQFDNEQSAEEWVARTIDNPKRYKSYNTGRTGDRSVLLYYPKTDLYELQFRKGRFVGDVAAFAPFDKASPNCDRHIRKLAELWFTSLSGY